MQKKLFYILIILFFSINLKAQFVDVYSYNSIHKAYKIENRILCICDNSIFFVDDDGQIEKHSNINYLSSAQITASTAYKNNYAIGYFCGKVDVFYNGKYQTIKGNLDKILQLEFVSDNIISCKTEFKEFTFDLNKEEFVTTTYLKQKEENLEIPLENIPKPNSPLLSKVKHISYIDQTIYFYYDTSFLMYSKIIDNQFVNTIDKNSKPLEFPKDSTLIDQKGIKWKIEKNGVYYMQNGNYYEPTIEYKDSYYYTLKDKDITCFAIDGANQKYFGTENKGIFVLNQDCSQEIANFNTENSPLCSNKIIDIEINQKNGYVYFATDKGVNCYTSNKSLSSDNLKNVKIYPNPIKIEDEIVNISNLKDQSQIIITDINGNLVYKTTALGGNIEWNLLNQNNDRISSGIYLIFVVDPISKEKIIKKLMVIN